MSPGSEMPWEVDEGNSGTDQFGTVLDVRASSMGIGWYWTDCQHLTLPGAWCLSLVLFILCPWKSLSLQLRGEHFHSWDSVGLLTFYQGQCCGEGAELCSV